MADRIHVKSLSSKARQYEAAKHLVRLCNNESISEPDRCFTCFVIKLIVLYCRRDSVLGGLDIEYFVQYGIRCRFHVKPLGGTRCRKSPRKSRAEIGRQAGIPVDGRSCVFLFRCLTVPVTHQLVRTTRHGDELHPRAVGRPVQNSPCLSGTSSTTPMAEPTPRRHCRGGKRTCTGSMGVRVLGWGHTHINCYF